MIPKLRTWDKQDKRMSYGEVYYFNDMIEYRFDHLCTEADEDVEFMQSTGIKDKNGVEIYEGDILKLHAIFLAPDDKIGYLEYSPKYGYSIIFEGNRLYRQEYWASTNKLNYEVIGNIYENPELLREDTKND
ncbi:MAG: YopX family protein [Lactococcus lactis]